MSSIFLDSSILVEYRKGVQTALFDAIMEDETLNPCINQAVVSEYLFYHLAIFGGKSPLTLKTNGDAAFVMQKYDPLPFLSLFEWLPDDSQQLPLVVGFMKTYGLLSNDALIIASCKRHKIKVLISYDPDFQLVCQKEGITLLSSSEDLAAYKTASLRTP